MHTVLIRLKHIDGVAVEPLALQPQRGGPKNLPIVQSFLNDIEDDEQSQLKKKPHLVIVGGGWGVRTSLRYILVGRANPTDNDRLWAFLRLSNLAIIT
jgi:hypothetical protein